MHVSFKQQILATFWSVGILTCFVLKVSDFLNYLYEKKMFPYKLYYSVKNVLDLFTKDNASEKCEIFNILAEIFVT